MKLPVVRPHATLDLARPEDNDDVCALFRDVHVHGDLDLNQERDPDFFALQRLQGDPAYTYLARDDEGLAGGLASFVLRPGWLDGERVTTGYICDLRRHPRFRAGVGFIRHYDDVLAQLEAEHGAQVLTTVVFDDNELAHKVLMGPSARRRGQPPYRVMTPFRMTSVQFTRRKRGPKRRIDEATPADLDALEAFLTRRGKQRVLGEDFSDGLLRRRLATWPGFRLEDFLLARGPTGGIVGCLAPWDTSAVKRTRVLGYHGQMAWVKRGFDVGATVLRWPRLPEPGDCFRFAFLTHLEVDGDDPDVLNALLRAAYRRLRPQRLHFMSALVPVGSPLEAAFGGFTVQHTAMTLYAVHRASSPLADRDFRTLHPGFEIALS